QDGSSPTSRSAILEADHFRPASIAISARVDARGSASLTHSPRRSEWISLKRPPFRADIEKSRLMDESQAIGFPALSALADKTALELVFAQPGSDVGLLPV